MIYQTLPGRSTAGVPRGWHHFTRALEIARADEHGRTVRYKFFCDLESDSLIGSGDQGNSFVVDGDVPFATFGT